MSASNNSNHQKLAFLFLTYDNLSQPKVWEQFFAGAPPDSYSLYVHPKHPEQVTDALLWPHIITTLIPTKWAHISCVAANLLLMQAAYEDKSNYKAILVSDSCIPLYPFQHIYEALMSDEHSCFHYFRGCQHRWHSLPKGWIAMEKFLKNNAQGLLFNRELMHYYLTHRYLDIPWSVPEEHYFINVLIHEGVDYEKKVVNKRLTYANWDEPTNNGASPKLYELVDRTTIDKVRGTGKLFMRKIASKAAVDINCLWSNPACAGSLQRA